MCAITGLIGLPQMRVAINIPAYRLDVYVAGSLVRSMPVAVGMPSFRTPRGLFEISSVEWNPWWIPPDRPWAAGERPMRPGPANPMGRVKLNFRPLYFLHGTPLEGSIGSAASHGCIRLDNTDAIELARIVHRFGSPSLTADDVVRLVTDTATTRLLKLDHAIPLEIRYDLVEIRGAWVGVYRDVYRLASQSLRDAVYVALRTYGVDTALLDSARVRALVRQVPPTGRTIPIDSLIYAGVADARTVR
jgi:murein L,D-transpeptidase YcbB/YkuD